MFYKTKNQKGQVGETMTWIIATIVIIVILVFSIFIASIVGRDKKFFVVNSRDLIVAKSLSGFLLTENDSGGRIFEQIKEEVDLNEISASLSVKIFRELYNNDYSNINLDIRGSQSIYQSPILQDIYDTPHSPVVTERIYLHKDKNEYLGVFLS